MRFLEWKHDYVVLFRIEDEISKVRELIFPGHVPSDKQHLEFVWALVERVNAVQDILLKRVQILGKKLLLWFLLFARLSIRLLLGNRTPMRPSNITHAVSDQLNLNLVIRLVRLLVFIFLCLLNLLGHDRRVLEEALCSCDHSRSSSDFICFIYDVRRPLIFRRLFECTI